MNRRLRKKDEVRVKYGGEMSGYEIRERKTGLDKGGEVGGGGSWGVLLR